MIVDRPRLRVEHSYVADHSVLRRYMHNAVVVTDRFFINSI